MHLFYAPHLQRKDRAAVGISMEPLHLKSRELSKKHIHQLFILCRVADGNDAVLGIGFPYGIRKLMPLCRTKPSYRSSIHQLSYWGECFLLVFLTGKMLVFVTQSAQLLANSILQFG